MLGLPLAFTAPLVLGALALLPVLYYLLRLTPPRPRQISFPPLKLILDLQPKEETPARTPWWLLALRLLLAAIIILAMAGPVWNPSPQGEGGRGPLLVIMDDGWPAAVQWERRTAAASEAITSAARQGRASALVLISDGGREITQADPQTTSERLRARKPAPFIPDRLAALAPVRAWLARNRDGQILWISDALEQGNARKFAEGLREAAGANASIQMLSADKTPAAIFAADNAPGALEAMLRRADARATSNGRLRAYDLKGLMLGEAPFNFGAALETKARFEMPIELRNEIARIEIDGEKTAGAVTLLDSRWKRRRVAIVSGATADTAQPLLAATYYLTRALTPFADVREPRAGGGDPVLAVLEDKPSVIVFADVGVVARGARERLAEFIDNGGLLIRFAGTRVAAAADDLTPVKLRRGGRVLGGALSWEKPRQIAPFEQSSPFHGLEVPKEVAINRQVLAEPEAGLAAKTWAALDDGTPLVTAEKRGKGMIVLVHVTADTTWSNLPLSGLFVDLLRRSIALAGESAEGEASGTTNAAADRQQQRAATLAPARTLDGFGQLGAPPVTAKPLPVNYTGQPGADHPPGFYGPPDGFAALNPLGPKDMITLADMQGLNIAAGQLQPSEPIDMRPWMISLALLLFLIDAIATLFIAGGLRGLLRRRAARPAGAAAIVLAAVIAIAASGDVQAQTAKPQAAQQAQPSQRDIDAALSTRLAYIVTGDTTVDETSRRGLLAVSAALGARTALTPAEPAGIDPARDDLTFYPLIYWPIIAGKPMPPPQAIARIAAFMRDGGTILFDTRDALTNRPGEAPTPETAWLRQLLRGVDVPELEPVPRDHVVTKTFYLLDNIVGRYTTGQTWIEALPPPGKEDTGRPARAGDSVSPIIITSNDLAAAWAVDASGGAMFPLQGGMPRQREFALRGGINIVMYTLTGNYKSDQVHARDIIERLGL